MPMVLVSTCREFAPKTLPRLCASLRRAKADYIIVGDGFTETTKVEGETVEPAPVSGLWDLTALVYAARLPYSWYFLMSDTCEVDPDFKAKVKPFTIDWQYDLTGLVPGVMMCFMGLYHQSYIARNARRISNLSGMSKHRLIVLEESADLPSWARMYRHVHSREDLVQWDRQEDVYGTGRPRWHRYFPAFGVTKWTVARYYEEVKADRARQL